MPTLRRLAPHWPLLAVPILTLAFFYRLAFTDLILGRGDTYNYFYPYWGARNAALAQGRLPLWTPDLFMGAPLLADPQLGTFYPPNWLTLSLSAPDAVRISILLHVAWAMLGAYALARRGLALERIPALLAAGIYGLGGHVGAHVEQINQLQGLAWMPWLFLLYHLALSKPLRWTPLLAIALALQVFTGHTQTVFITLVGLGLYGVLAGARRASLLWTAGLLKAALILVLAGLGALLLAAPQIAPAWELMSASNRSGGLNPNQATAFSLNPLLVGRGLLPSYDGLLFGEYIAYVGVIGVALSVVGVMGGNITPRPPQTSPPAPLQSGEGRKAVSARLVWLVIAVAGLLLALGLYNPLYWALASLPGFNLFRVPARWLALFGLGTAMLAGMGVQTLASSTARLSRRALAAILVIPGALAGAVLLTPLAPPEDISGPALPTAMTLGGWALAFAAFVFLAGRSLRLRTALMAAAALGELFLAAQILPYNDLVPPDVYNTPRFTVSQLRAYHEGRTPPGRVLSISELLFDPGDKAVLEARYRERGLDDLAVRHALVAVKRQETLFPNLTLTWNIPGVDGFGGGLLPTSYYTAFTALMIPPDELRTIDGRLGEIMARADCRGACIPDQRWLTLTNTRYLITDKVYDVVHEGVFYDTAFAISVQPETAYSMADLPDFEANALDVLYSGESAPTAVFTYPSGQEEPLQSSDEQTELDGLKLARLTIPEARTPASITLRAATPVTVHGLSLVDTRTGDFVQLTPAPWRKLLSSDIKLYENQDALPRAFVVHQNQTVADSELGTQQALDIMNAANFDPARQAVITGDVETLSSGPIITSSTEIVAYEAERVEIAVNAGADGYMILTDAYYPGWTATVDGKPSTIYRADAMFRAVKVPAGESSVIFEYRPAWFPGILVLGALAWLAALLSVAYTFLRN